MLALKRVAKTWQIWVITGLAMLVFTPWLFAGGAKKPPGTDHSKSRILAATSSVQPLGGNAGGTINFANGTGIVGCGPKGMGSTCIESVDTSLVALTGAPDGTGPYLSREIWFKNPTNGGPLYSGIRMQDAPPGQSAADYQLYFEGSAGGNTDGINPGATGGLTAIGGGLGGNGDATHAPGAGGELDLRGGTAGSSGAGGAGPPNGFGSAVGGDVYIRGGTGAGGARNGSIYVGLSSTDSITLGVAGTTPVNVLGNFIPTLITFSANAVGDITNMPPPAATNSQTLEVFTSNGGVSTAGAAGGNGGAINILTGNGGNGSATKAAGRGGDILVRAGNAGTAGSGVGANGGSFTAQVGASSGSGVNGAMFIGSDGASPSSIVIGQSSTPTVTVHGQSVTIGDGPVSIQNAGFKGTRVDKSGNYTMTAGVSSVYYKSNLSSDEFDLPNPASLGLGSGGEQCFSIQCDDSCATNHVNIWALPYGSTKINGVITQFSGTGSIILREAYAAATFCTDGSNYFVRSAYNTTLDRAP